MRILPLSDPQRQRTHCCHRNNTISHQPYSWHMRYLQQEMKKVTALQKKHYELLTVDIFLLKILSIQIKQAKGPDTIQ